MPQSQSITLISKLRVGACVALAVVGVASCKLEPESESGRVRLGTIRMAVVSSVGTRAGFALTGKVTRLDVSDTSAYNVSGVGAFKSFISFKSTTSADTARVYYSLPVSAPIRLDTSTYRVVFTQVLDRAALLIKDKNDSLVCLFGSLLPTDLAPVQAMSGVQNIRITSGDIALTTRPTQCGREGDFNTLFFDGFGWVSVRPAATSSFVNGDRSYLVANVANTSLIKNTTSCPDSVGEFVYMIIRL